MDLRNRIGLYGSYFLGMSGIGFTLPFFPLYLGERGMSDRAIGIVSTRWRARAWIGRNFQSAFGRITSASASRS